MPDDGDVWVYRLGVERAKRMLLTGDTIDGTTAADWGLYLPDGQDALALLREDGPPGP